MSTPKEPHEDGTAAPTASSSATSGTGGAGSSPEATTRVAKETPEVPGDAAAPSASAGAASSGGDAGGPPPPWQRAAGGAPAGGAPAGGAAPRSGAFPASGGGRPPAGGGRPASESGAMPTARPESGAMPSARSGPVPGAARPEPGERPGPGPSSSSSSARGAKGPSSSATALIDAPTNQLSPEQLGMRDRGSERSEGADGDDAGSRGARGSKAPRRASLQVRRFDPWSVLKLALVLGVALFFVWMFAVGVLYAVLDGMGVWAQLNGTYQDLTSDAGGGGDLITAAGVFGIAAIIGVVNTILFTALACVSAFIYNISADVAGGIEVTLSERD